MTVRAPAKINLQLGSGPPRPDGYHDLATVFHAVSLYDEVTASADEPGAGEDDVTVTVEGPGARRPAGRAPTSRSAPPCCSRTHAAVGSRSDLHIRKGIPVAGGMAGGSADAAAALVACDALWHTGLGRDELLELAAELGADVPFALLGGTAMGTGRGDELTPALARGDFHWVLALADGGLSTPDGLRASSTGSAAAGVLPEPRVPDGLMQALRARRRRRRSAALLSNDLQPAALSLRPT